MEKTYKELSPKAKRGLNRFSRFSTKTMKKVSEDYRNKTGVNPSDVTRKEQFFEYVATWKIR